jgi:exopolysaccharide biosynthesis predicted pyruvyltransferase EpsI
VKFLYSFQKLLRIIDKRLGTRLFSLFTDAIFLHFIRGYNVRTGVRFLQKYQHVVTTRLHAGILAYMLGIESTLLDNSYGKNKNVFDSWLKNEPIIHFK